MRRARRSRGGRLRWSTSCSRCVCLCFPMMDVLMSLQSVQLQHERSERLKTVTAEVKALKP